MPGIWHQAGCCCGVPCEFCDGDTPSTVILTCTGLTLCGCWGSTVKFDFTFPATWTMKRPSAFPCYWTKAAYQHAVYKAWPGGSNCVGVPDNVWNGHLYASYEKKDGTAEVVIQAYHVQYGNHIFFFDSIVTDSCTDSETFTNDFVAGDCWTWYEGLGGRRIAGYGGTITT